MPRVVIKKEDLPPINAATGQYTVRFRFVSEDRNRFSYWTPFYNIDAPTITGSSAILKVDNTTTPHNFTAVWDDPDFLHDYDIFIRFSCTGITINHAEVDNNVVKLHFGGDCMVQTGHDILITGVDEGLGLGTTLNGTHTITETDLVNGWFTYSLDHADLAYTAVTPPGNAECTCGWEHYGVTTSNTFSFLQKYGANNMEFVAQRRGFPLERNTNLQLFAPLVWP